MSRLFTVSGEYKGLLAIGILFCAVPVAAQSGSSDTTPEWQAAAGGNMAFEVASVKASVDQPFRPPVFPLSSDDSWTNSGGHFFADFPLSVYIQFAWKVRLTPDQVSAMLAPLPKWVATDRFTIQATAHGSPTKDQFRLMMQSLLAERFGLKVHFETRHEKIFALTLVKPGRTGPKLIPHDSGPPCDSTPSTSPDGPYPDRCDVYSMLIRGDGLSRLGSRNTTMDLLADGMPVAAGLGRPVVDRTGLKGRFDFVLEFAAERPNAGPVDLRPAADPAGPSFITALREQLGLKLDPAEGPVRTLVVDHVERPSDN